MYYRELRALQEENIGGVKRNWKLASQPSIVCCQEGDVKRRCSYPKSPLLVVQKRVHSGRSLKKVEINDLNGVGLKTVVALIENA